MTLNINLSTLIDKTFTTQSENLKSNNPHYIVIHSTEKNYNFESLYALHVNKYKWKGVGYHIFVSKGEAFKSREFNLEGAHCLGLNFNSIGLCIYSNKGMPTELDLNIAKELIADIKSHYGPISILSHTLAQVRYINKLSRKKGLITNVNDTIELNSNDEFLEIKERLLDFSAINSLHKHPYLESQIKNFKNCPGEGFYEFIAQLNKNK
jgi:hypothetical protein